MINRKIRRASESNGRKTTRGGWSPFVEVTRAEAMAAARITGWPEGTVNIWRNNLFVVFHYEHDTTWGVMDRYAVRRCDAQPIRSWGDMQRIKNELAGPKTVAVEVYPPEGEVFDAANVYHLWILPEGFPLPFVMGAGR